MILLQVNTTTFSSDITSIMTTTTEAYPPIADLYAISYSYYSLMGFGATLFIGLFLSLISGKYFSLLRYYKVLPHSLNQGFNKLQPFLLLACKEFLKGLQLPFIY